MSELQLRWRREIDSGRREQWRASVRVGGAAVIATARPVSHVIDDVRRTHWYGWLRWEDGRRGITEVGQSTAADAMRDCEKAVLRGLDDDRRRDVVRQQWLDTAETDDERAQLRGAWRREPELRWLPSSTLPDDDDKIEVQIFVRGTSRGAIIRTYAGIIADYPSLVIRGRNGELVGFESESLDSAQLACERDLLDDLDPQTRREVVRQQWLRTAVSAHERMQLRAAWQQQDEKARRTSGNATNSVRGETDARTSR